MRLFRPRDLTSALWPLYFMSKLFGLAPYTLVSHRDSTTVVTSAFSTSYCTTLAGVFLALNIRMFCLNMGMGYSMNPSVLVVMLQFFVMVLATLMSHLSLVFNRRRMVSVFKKLQHVDELLEIPAGQHHVTLWRNLALTCLVTSCFGLVVTLNLLYEVDTSTPALLCLLVCLLQVYLSHLVQLQFVGLVVILCSRFVAVNATLQTELTSDRETTPYSLSSLTTAHSVLCNIAEDVGSTYSMHILFSFTLKFLVITGSLFFNLLDILKEHDDKYIPTVWSSLSSLWFVWTIADIAVTVIACTRTTEQASRTGCIVHRQLINISNIELKRILQLFSHQLLHRNVKFTASNLFTLDCVFLYSMTGTVTTYLLILLQFHLGGR